jgi:dolichol-phosphate mannosyltransferase
MPELSVVVPVFNEAAVLPTFHERVTAAVAQCARDVEILYVDDGSVDASPAILLDLADRDPKVRVIRFSRNFGHQAAVTAGIEHAAGAAVVVIDSDLQDPPEVIPDLVAQWRAGFEVVSAVRTVREGESPVRLMLIKIFYRGLRLISSTDMTPDVGDFRLLDRRVAQALNRLPERNRYVRGLIRWVGFRHTEVRYRRAARFAGETKYPYSKLIRLAFDGVTAFSTWPLRMVTYLGFAVSALSLVLVAWGIYGAVMSGRAPQGWPSVFVAVSFLSGVQLVAIGILGAYVGRIFEEVKARPLYVVASDTGEGSAGLGSVAAGGAGSVPASGLGSDPSGRGSASR